MDSSDSVFQEGISRKSLKDMVARDGIGQHYPSITLPFTGIYLDPALDAGETFKPQYSPSVQILNGNNQETIDT